MAQKSRFLQAVPRRQGQRVRLGRRPGLARRQASRCGTTLLAHHFVLKVIIVPIQARDKHRETFTFSKGKRFLQVEASTPKVQWLTFSKSLASATAVATHNPSRPRPLKETQSLRRPTGSDTTTPTSPVQTCTARTSSCPRAQPTPLGWRSVPLLVRRTPRVAAMSLSAVRRDLRRRADRGVQSRGKAAARVRLEEGASRGSGRASASTHTHNHQGRCPLTLHHRQHRRRTQGHRVMCTRQEMRTRLCTSILARPRTR